jgi:hypothetical protein
LSKLSLLELPRSQQVLPEKVRVKVPTLARDVGVKSAIHQYPQVAGEQSAEKTTMLKRLVPFVYFRVFHLMISSNLSK